MSDQKSIEFVETIAASPAQVYAAFGSSIAWQSWFSDFAEVVFREKGRLYCWWDVGYYASGLFTKVVENERIAFTWSGPNEPHGTQVEISLREKAAPPKMYAPEVDVSQIKVTEVVLRHSGLGVGNEWVERVAAYQKGWEVGLANLKSVMETGVDKRLYDKPMLGIMIGALLDEEQAAELNVPLPYGVVLAGVMEGMGAEAAGLQQDDILVSLNQQDLKKFEDFGPATKKCKAGDTVDVVFYRDGEQHTVQMTLSHRQIPEVPHAAAALSETVAQEYAAVADEREALFEGVSDAAASVRPAPEEWSAKETLVHLLYTERWLHFAISCVVSEQRTGGFANELELIAAMAGAYPLEELLLEIKRSEAVTVASFKALPDAFVADKRKFVRLVTNLGQGFPAHTRSHFDQIKAAIEAASAG